MKCLRDQRINVFRTCKRDADKEKQYYLDQGYHVSKEMSKLEALELLGIASESQATDRSLSCYLVWYRLKDRRAQLRPVDIIEWVTGRNVITFIPTGAETWKAVEGE